MLTERLTRLPFRATGYTEGGRIAQLLVVRSVHLMAERLDRLKGRFILSINDVSEIRDLFADFAMEEAGLLYSVGGGKGQPARELIISGAAK